MQNHGLLLAGILSAAIASCLFAFWPWVAVAIDAVAIGLLVAYAVRHAQSGHVHRPEGHHGSD